MGRSGRPLGEVLREKSERSRALVQGRPAAKLMAASELPRVVSSRGWGGIVHLFLYQGRVIDAF